MPGNKWFMTAIVQAPTGTGYIIVITTDTPCHLWMRWTTVIPKEHLIQRTKRGLPLMLEKYYCFDVYEDNQQEEAGDTLIHTFVKEPWPVCETRYFYFHGEIAGVASPSTTPIFQKHRPQPVEPPKHEYHAAPLASIYGQARDGRMAQSFTPQADYAISNLVVPMSDLTYPDGGIWHVQIRTNNVNEPSETILWEDTLNVHDFPPAGCKWFVLDVTGVNAQNGIPLWIVGFRTGYTWWWDYPHQAGDPGDLYPRGEALFQDSPTGSWSGKGEGHDLGFIIWGT